MKKYLTLITVALALGAMCSFAAASDRDQSGSVVVVTLDGQGNIVATDIDGEWDVLIGYGDPDDGITGNRGDSCGNTAGLLGNADLSESDLLGLLMLWLQQWTFVAR